MFSLAGVPPLWGFFAKLTAFQAAIQADMTWLAVGGVIASVISAFYYLNIVRRIYFADAREPLTLRGGLGHRIALGGTALIIIFAVAPVINGFGALEAAAVAAESLAGLVP
jgi:NADH-quinone oxidoreductase subunit N